MVQELVGEQCRDRGEKHAQNAALSSSHLVEHKVHHLVCRVRLELMQRVARLEILEAADVDQAHAQAVTINLATN